ncbi:MAG: NUDIX hydrolase [Runella slithyformis]|jgi:8-oxo-dGTP pyrophosphatase MutT (NUDIX family)|nr:MAG: NUDIX hydrolase [Cytophagales bacterium]TAF79414.1 MAG: NUDIX hydrolase [Runella slithyformis]TAH11043.1 MAG: NUDIX hydrolase [Runella slithyformis]
MIIFIKDRPVRILDETTAKTRLINLAPDKVIDARLEMLKVASLRGNVLILNASPITTEKLFHFLNNFDLPDLQSIYLVVKEKEVVEKQIKKMYAVIKAAGGIVTKDEKLLLIHRRGVWDLPKGKLDNNEKSKKAALREVEEETGVRAELMEKVCTTWHTYSQGGELVLKRTRWYWMRCLDDSRMLPQLEEQIDRLDWMTEAEVRTALLNSFSSIRYVVNCFLRQEIDME